jgi:hypothetical protein
MNTAPPVSRIGEELTLSGVLQVSTVEAKHLPLTEALQLSREVVRLVAESHDRGQVVGVLDAAHLICSVSGSLAISRTGGNPIAPELKRGEMPDRLTDVYALGALMYRLLTGRKVEPQKIIEPPSHFNPAVDSALDELVLCALDEDPSERPYSARDLEERLLDIYDELGLEDTRTEATNLIAKAKQRPSASAAAPKRKTAAYAPPARPPRAETMDVEPADDDEDEDWQPHLERNPLDKRWMIGGLAVLALFLAAFVVWPSGSKKESARADDDSAPAKVAKGSAEKAAPALAAAEPVKAVMVDPPSGDTMKVKKLKVAESPKKSTRRARR